jgi:hypothetical protein
MDVITREIERALDNNLFYLAIIASLTLPDICSALESEDGIATKKKYIAWCDSWFLPKYPTLTSIELYSLRCGIIHQGKATHTQINYSRILFTLPVPQHTVLHNNIMNDALNLDASIFCHDMIQCVVNWYIQEKTSPYVLANLPNMVRYYSNGLAPYVVGFPIIT